MICKFDGVVRSASSHYTFKNDRMRRREKDDTLIENNKRSATSGIISLFFRLHLHLHSHFNLSIFLSNAMKYPPRIVKNFTYVTKLGMVNLTLPPL